MGSGKKEANRKVRQGKTGDGMANVKMKGENFYRYIVAISWSVGKDVMLISAIAIRRRSRRSTC